MKMRLPEPRLLPATIAVLALLLAVKSTVLVRGLLIAGEVVGSSMLPAAQAASQDADNRPEAKHGEKPAAKHGEKSPATLPDAKPVARTPEVAAAAALAAEAKVEPQEAPISDSERTILLELRQRRKELDIRETMLSGREAMLAATERKLSGRVEELQSLQKKLEALDATRVAKEDSGWQGLVKLYQNMKPREAAAILNDLDMAVLLPVMDRMKEAKAAPILSAMQPEKARDITDGLAKLRTRLPSAMSAGAPLDREKGG